MRNGLLDYVAAPLKEIWKKEVIPKEWKTTLIYSIHKKGDTSIHM